MKKTIALTLCASLAFIPLHRTRAVVEVPTGPSNSVAMAICLVGGGALVGGAVVYMLKTCKPKYYCVQDEDGRRFASNASKTERIANDWKVKSGPYQSAEEARQYCPPTTNAPTGLVMMAGLENGDDEVYIPQIQMKVWKSTNLVTWSHVDTILDDPTHFTWADTNAISSHKQAFYRVSY